MHFSLCSTVCLLQNISGPNLDSGQPKVMLSLGQAWVTEFQLTEVRNRTRAIGKFNQQVSEQWGVHQILQVVWGDEYYMKVRLCSYSNTVVKTWIWVSGSGLNSFEGCSCRSRVPISDQLGRAKLSLEKCFPKLGLQELCRIPSSHELTSKITKHTRRKATTKESW